MARSEGGVLTLLAVVGFILRIATAGFACPNSDCLYYGITDDQIHAFVGCDGTPFIGFGS